MNVKAGLKSAPQKDKNKFHQTNFLSGKFFFLKTYLSEKLMKFGQSILQYSSECKIRYSYLYIPQ